MVLSTTTICMNSTTAPWKLRVTLIVLLIVFVFVIISREKNAKHC